MPSTNWSKLSPLQLGRYAEYYAKMEFASYGFEVYTSEVDDHGVDFIAKNPYNKQFYEVQVKSMRNTGYVFVQKEKIELQENWLLCLMRFVDGALPEVGDGDIHALAGASLGDAQAHAAGAAGDECGFTFQINEHVHTSKCDSFDVHILQLFWAFCQAFRAL